MSDESAQCNDAYHRSLERRFYNSVINFDLQGHELQELWNVLWTRFGKNSQEYERIESLHTKAVKRKSPAWLKDARESQKYKVRTGQAAVVVAFRCTGKCNDFVEIVRNTEVIQCAGCGSRSLEMHTLICPPDKYAGTGTVYFLDPAKGVIADAS